MTNFNSVSLAPSGGSAVSGALTPRYEYVSVLNETGLEIWVRTDGTAATVDGDFCSAVAPGERALLANMNLLWTQAQTVLPAGTHNQWGQAQNGGVANPGTSISFIPVASSGFSSTPTVTIQGAG
jgi:hypothetical protein